MISFDLVKKLKQCFNNKNYKFELIILLIIESSTFFVNFNVKNTQTRFITKVPLGDTSKPLNINKSNLKPYHL